MKTVDISIENKKTEFDFNYSVDAVMRKKMITYPAVISALDSVELLTADTLPQSLCAPLCEMSEEQRRELVSHLFSYTEKILICECGKALWAFVPSIYPSSTLCVAFGFDASQLSIAELLRLVRCEKCSDLFIASEHINTKLARMTPALLQKGEVFFEWCSDIRECFMDIGRISSSDDESAARDKILKQIFKISEAVGCPINEITELESISNRLAQIDFPLFTAFVFTFVALAKNLALDRSIDVELRVGQGELTVRLYLDSVKCADISDALLAWEAIAADKNMAFEFSESGGKSCVGLQPIRRDWSYLCLKQKLEF